MKNISDFIKESQDYIKNIRYSSDMYDNVTDILRDKSDVDFDFDVNGKMYKLYKDAQTDAWGIKDDKGRAVKHMSPDYKKALRYLNADPNNFNSLLKEMGY